MEGVIYHSGGGDLPHPNTSPRAPVGAKNLRTSLSGPYKELEHLEHGYGTIIGAGLWAIVTRIITTTTWDQSSGKQSK